MYCTNCGAEISDNAVVCVKCGCDPAGNVKYCANCGAEAANGAVACVKCGCALSGSKNPVANGAESNRWLISLLLCIFLGTLGIHNFYVGNTKTGVWQLLITLLVCIPGYILSYVLGAFLIFPFFFVPVFFIGMFIWPLIDFIKILKGTFPDGKNGGYVTK